MRRNLRCGARAAFPAPGRPGWHHGAVEQRLSLVTLGVADLARSRAFYEALGWTTRAEPDDDVVFFQAGGMIVALWGRTELAGDSGVQDEGGWGGVTLAHNVRSPQEVDAMLTEAGAAGAAIARPGAATFWGGSEPSRRPAPLPQRRGPGQQLTPAADAAAGLSETIAGVQPPT